MNTPSIARFRSYLDDEPTMREGKPWHQTGAELAINVPPPAAMVRSQPWRRRPAEKVESLSLPDGLREEMLPVGAPPVGPQQARIWLIRLARDLARDYRTWYGVELRDDAPAIEWMQRHLSAAAEPLSRRDPKAVARELVRHGLLLGELLVRTLGATWIDLSGDRPGAWELFVPSAETLNPIVRVQRFMQQGIRESDLIALFLDLDAAQRRAR